MFKIKIQCCQKKIIIYSLLINLKLIKNKFEFFKISILS